MRATPEEHQIDQTTNYFFDYQLAIDDANRPEGGAERRLQNVAQQPCVHGVEDAATYQGR
jgi:hypothetical protein